MKSIKVARVVLGIDGILEKRDAEKIRGYLAEIFWENPIVHHHLPDGQLVYEYPKIQYKIIKGNCFIVAFDEGIEVVEKVFNDLKDVFLTNTWKSIHSKALEIIEQHFGPSLNPIEYIFLTPWLALNEKNYKQYKELKNKIDKKVFLANILNANIISIAKSIGYTISSKIHTELVRLKPVVVNFKNAKFIGFYGKFKTNFVIPSLWGIGKSVSRGFGAVASYSELMELFNGILNLFPENIPQLRKRKL